jgi:hypothetical protein
MVSSPVHLLDPALTCAPFNCSLSSQRAMKSPTAAALAALMFERALSPASFRSAGTGK